MDKTKTYIYQCKNAIEIQNHKIEWDDLYADDCCGLHNVTIKDFIEKSFDSENKTQAEWLEENCTWIPRQDQLQEMYGITDAKGGNYKSIALVHAFFEFVRFTTEEETLEQLWLSFIMNVNFKKEWNGKEWVKLYSK